LEFGGADISEVNRDGDTVWDLLEDYLIEPEYDGAEDKAEKVTTLLRFMVLRGAPPAELTAELSTEHQRVVEEGARLRARIPSYLAKRRALIDTHCPLIAPLCALVSDYEEPTTTEELWETGLGAEPQTLRLA
jgi:hypothetical protein